MDFKEPEGVCFYVDLLFQALGALNKKDLSELKSFPRPNPKLMIVLEAVMTLLGCETSFAEAKKQLGEAKFLEWVSVRFFFF